MIIAEIEMWFRTTIWNWKGGGYPPFQIMLWKRVRLIHGVGNCLRLTAAPRQIRFGMHIWSSKRCGKSSIMYLLQTIIQTRSSQNLGSNQKIDIRSDRGVYQAPPLSSYTASAWSLPSRISAHPDLPYFIYNVAATDQTLVCPVHYPVMVGIPVPTDINLTALHFVNASVDLRQ